MKTLIFKITALFMFVIALTGCSKGYDKDKVSELADRVARGEEFTQSDYSDMIDYTQAAFDEVIPKLEKLKEQTKDEADKDLNGAAMVLQQIDDILQPYEDVEVLGKALDSASEEQMGADNYKRYNEIKDTNKKKIEAIFETAIK